MLDFDLQSHKPLREIVYDQLKVQILEGKITPGTRMMEVSLAEEMGVSRTPVREAIRKLERDGLVVIEPRRGAYASEISVKDIVDTLIVREDLESLAAELAAKVITPDQISELKEVAKRFANAIDAGDPERMIDGDEEIHRLIVTFSGNKTLMQLSETVQELALRFRYLYFDDFSRYRHVPDEHNAIIDALQDGDADRAREAARTHVHNLRQFVIDEGATAFKNKKQENEAK